ncbi:MAG: helix-turn-helix transcriptional regulator [Neisseria zoodegmatis]|uniref:helix-turn-helix transcriptional regulator n=1 Tax=Neisseria zoodegmatis TaxID=326523 RepID=UPI0026F27AD8|nr:helix-turn-helix transcriptional regulator [Neisseria zoodegmatis]MDO5068888.1 helix-turn-helix transcriptional regulator [Neisseria zoodegmatis]
MSLTIGEIQLKIRLNIVRLRREKSYTQESLANELSYSQAFINQIETGQRDCNIEQVYKIASVFKCSVYEILPDVVLDLEK